MPLTPKGEEIKAAMTKQYGEKKGEQVLYASKNKGTITGIDAEYVEAGRGLTLSDLNAQNARFWEQPGGEFFANTPTGVPSPLGDSKDAEGWEKRGQREITGGKDEDPRNRAGGGPGSIGTPENEALAKGLMEAFAGFKSTPLPKSHEHFQFLPNPYGDAADKTMEDYSIYGEERPREVGPQEPRWTPGTPENESLAKALLKGLAGHGQPGEYFGGKGGPTPTEQYARSMMTGGDAEDELIPQTGTNPPNPDGEWEKRGQRVITNLPSGEGSDNAAYDAWMDALGKDEAVHCGGAAIADPQCRAKEPPTKAAPAPPRKFGEGAKSQPPSGYGQSEDEKKTAPPKSPPPKSVPSPFGHESWHPRSRKPADAEPPPSKAELEKLDPKPGRSQNWRAEQAGKLYDRFKKKADDDLSEELAEEAVHPGIHEEIGEDGVMVNDPHGYKLAADDEPPKTSPSEKSAKNTMERVRAKHPASTQTPSPYPKDDLNVMPKVRQHSEIGKATTAVARSVRMKPLGS